MPRGHAGSVGLSLAEPDALASWRDGATRQAIVAFVESASREVPPAERVAVFDNDGTLWCEKPMPVELGFVLARLSEMAEKEPALRERQPWKAAREGDHAWLGAAVTKHYAGDDADARLLLRGAFEAFAGWTVERYAAAADAFVANAVHPTLGRPYCACGYQPMVELLRYLAAHEFTTYIASGGSRDFMRGFAQAVYGIPPERVIGSTSELRYGEDAHGGSIVYAAAPDIFDDGPAKPVRIWSRTGRRPILACGNSNGDLAMLEFTDTGPSHPSLQLLVLHDDAEREIAYDAGADRVLARARAKSWSGVSMARDWDRVFSD